MDREFVKYQSTMNSSWFIGFDRDGNPISGHISIKRDGSKTSIERERCYQFMKVNSVATTTLLFPEAHKVNPINKIDRKNNIDNIHNSNNRTTSQLVSATISAHLNPRPAMYKYHQGQLIDMTRYRNILRYQLGIRSMDQPLIAIENKNGNNSISRTYNRHQATKAG